MPGSYGCVGRLLKVDLDHGGLADEALPESFMRAFIGGYGLGARLLHERMPRLADPMGPDAVLGFVTGLLTGTSTPLSGRHVIVGKSPLTGGWGDANSGGRWGPELKFAGYDGVLVRGIAHEPVYLHIEDGAAQLRPATDLWGLDCVETEEALRSRHGDRAQVACIGPAGEQLSLISGVVTDRGRIAARSGLGAVMGAKRLKAIVVRGGIRPRVALPGRMKELRDRYVPMCTKDLGEQLRRYGTPMILKETLEKGRTAIMNWKGNFPDDFPHPERLDGPIRP